MSATDIIEQIKRLPPEEKARVVEFVQTLPPPRHQVRYLDEPTFEAAARMVRERYNGVLRRLAQ